MFENWLAGRCAPSAVPLVGDVVETSEMARQNGKELSYLRNRQGQVWRWRLLPLLRQHCGEEASFFRA